jgi:hypothetical protein
MTTRGVRPEEIEEEVRNVEVTIFQAEDRDHRAETHRTVEFGPIANAQRRRCNAEDQRDLLLPDANPSHGFHEPPVPLVRLMRGSAAFAIAIAIELPQRWKENAMSPELWLDANYSEWARLSLAEKTAIRDFPVLWAIFELAATEAEANPDTIRQAVYELAAVPASSDLEGCLSYFRNRYYHGGHPTQHHSYLRMKPKHWATYVQPVLADEESDPRRVLLALLLIVHRLRNNFLHGEKMRYGFSDQLDNFRNANRTLLAAIPLWPKS